MIKIIFFRGVGSGTFNASASIRVKTPFYKIYQYSTFFIVPTLEGVPFTPATISLNPDGFTARFSSNISESANVKSFVNIIIDGEFNHDSFVIELTGDTRRLEIRNENDVLLADNGKPWPDGTYPPDAKNRAGLAGLHAAPAVINPELETALMGDETNKERVQE